MRNLALCWESARPSPKSPGALLVLQCNTSVESDHAWRQCAWPAENFEAGKSLAVWNKKDGKSLAVWKKKGEKSEETKKQKKGKDFFAADKRGLTQIWRGRKESKSLVVWENWRKG